MTTRDSTLRGSALSQASELAFRALGAITLIVALAWLASSVRQIGPEQRAVITRMGALHRTQNAGLLLAWPRPFEEVALVPAAETVLVHEVQGLRLPEAIAGSDTSLSDDDHGVPLSDELAGAGYLLTGDAGVVQLEARVFYRVVDPFAYVLQSVHVLPALDRLITRSALALCAARDLDGILVARPELVGAESAIAERRERFRSELGAEANRRLADLTTRGASLGIEVVRVDATARPHPSSLVAFNTVLTADQQVLQDVAEARTYAAQITQTAAQAADRTIELARAQASERVAQAQAETAAISQLSQAGKDEADPGLLLRLYRERMAAILAKAQSVTLVNPRDDSGLIIQGTER